MPETRKATHALLPGATSIQNTWELVLAAVTDWRSRTSPAPSAISSPSVNDALSVFHVVEKSSLWRRLLVRSGSISSPAEVQDAPLNRCSRRGPNQPLSAVAPE